MNVVVENARTATINKADDTLTVAKGNRSATISEGNDTLTISKGNRTTTVTEGNHTVSVAKGNETYDVKGTRDMTVTGAETQTNKADYTWNISGNLDHQGRRHADDPVHGRRDVQIERRCHAAIGNGHDGEGGERRWTARRARGFR